LRENSTSRIHLGEWLERRDEISTMMAASRARRLRSSLGGISTAHAGSVLVGLLSLVLAFSIQKGIGLEKSEEPERPESLFKCT
jgi:hypothetical protein